MTSPCPYCKGEVLLTRPAVTEVGLEIDDYSCSPIVQTRSAWSRIGESVKSTGVLLLGIVIFIATIPILLGAFLFMFAPVILLVVAAWWTLGFPAIIGENWFKMTGVLILRVFHVAFSSFLLIFIALLPAVVFFHNGKKRAGEFVFWVVWISSILAVLSYSGCFPPYLRSS